MDVVTAFLAGDIKETIFIEQLEEFEMRIDKVCLLLKSLYSLKQVARI
jgi:Reverse transcriptase (RNA-dependent DNA polymerase)